MTLLPSIVDIMILFALIVISIFWLLDSNFSILLNFVLLYIIVGLLIIILGYEFLGISILLIYSSGIAIIFIITSMIVGTKHISVLSKDNNLSENSVKPFEENKLIFNILYVLFFILIFYTINFSQSGEEVISNLIVQSSFSGIFSTNSLILLNDIFILGFLIYNQYAVHTIIGGFILLISLIASIYISQVK